MRVNEMEVEFDYYLTLANLFDDGYPSVPHLHEPDVLAPGQKIESEPPDPKPEEHAQNDVPPWIKNK